MLKVILTERRKTILKYVVEEFILHGQPVGSENLLRRHALQMSSATVRAEMAELEEMGYLTHPHTSAGRVPTEKGYRIYVNYLLSLPPVPFQEEENIFQVLSRYSENLKEALAESCRLIAALSTYTSLALSPQLSQQFFRHLHFVPVSSRHALVILVTNVKIIQDELVELPLDTKEEDLEYLSHFLSQRFYSKTPWQSLQVLKTLKEGELLRFTPLLEQLENLMRNAFLYEQNERLIVEGTENILLSPDLQNAARIRGIIEALDRRFLLQEILERHLMSQGLQVLIGKENEVNEMQDLSLITMPFQLQHFNYGALGLLGPMRMDYGKAIRLLGCVVRILERTLQVEES